MRPMRRLQIVLIVVWAVFIQCNNSGIAPKPAINKELVFATYQYADNTRLDNLEPLIQWLTKNTGTPVKAVSFPSVKTLIAAINGGLVDIAMMNTSGYLTLQKNHPGVAEPAINLKMGNDSVTNYGSCIIASNKSFVKSLQELKDVQQKYSFALVDPSSTKC